MSCLWSISKGVLFLCYFINLSVKLSKLEFAKLIIRYLSIQFYLA